MKSILFLLPVVILSMTSCEKTVFLDIEQTPQKVVIEGWVTDHADHNFVKITRTNDFYQNGQTPRVQDATVSVEDSDGTIVTFAHYSGQNMEDSAGYYLPETPFAGEIGKTYTLTVVVDGVTYTAQDELLRLVPINKLEYRVNEDERDDPEEEGKFYELLMYVTEPKETRDYYLFKCFRNDSIKYATENDIYFADDELVGEDLDGIALPIFYGVSDAARVEVFSLTRNAFIYYRDLQKLLTNDGGLFGTPPANPRTNITGGALGFFQVSAVQTGELVIE